MRAAVSAALLCRWPSQGQAYARLEAGFFHVNIMPPAYPEMGAAFAANNKSSEGIHWVQVFGEAG